MIHPDRTTAVGWVRPAGSALSHYFAGPRSLCRRALAGDEPRTLGEPAEACDECRAVLRGWLRPKEGG